MLEKEANSDVNYRFLGKAGLKVSELCLGAMTFGRETNEEISHQMLDRFVEASGNFIDTCPIPITSSLGPKRGGRG